MGRGVFLAFIGLTLLLAAPFMVTSGLKGFEGLLGGAMQASRFHDPATPLANLGIFTHMIGGALITGLALLQTLPQIRRRWPALHRVTGRVTIVAALVTAIGGLTFIAMRGTIGGPWMSFGFTLYGLCTAVAAVMAWHMARRRDFIRHRVWGLRLVWLAVGSWLYRVMYGLWVVAVGEAGIAPDFSGSFDRVMVLAFFVPQLIALELWLRRRRAVEPAPTEG